MKTAPPHDATLVAKRDSTDGVGSATGQSTAEFLVQDPELHKDTYERLAWTALIYATAYFSAFTLSFALEGSRTYESMPAFEWTVMGLSVSFAVAVYVVCKRRLVPPHALYNFATAYVIVGALGINAGAWGWEADLHLDPYPTGIPWVCVWMLNFPTVMPAAPLRTLGAGAVAALSGPAIMLLSVTVHGLPAGATWSGVWRFIAMMTYPAIICAVMAYWTAILIYRLTRDAAKARRMGSYQLVERLGAGGMGEVWKARHRLLVRPAAIKLILPESLGRDAGARNTALKRFEREAQATAALRSPHTVELYDFGITDDSTFYYAMELLEGLDLKRLVEHYGPVPGDRTIHFLRQACHSLYDAHLAGLVHRDIKPANIYACRRGQDFDFVKVLDFGLVAPSERGRVDHGGAHLTLEGTVSGTPAFMAPEMASGERATDPRVDIYALGCVGYWLLTGRLLFEAPTAMGVILKHVNEPPPPPSSRTELPVHPELERIILWCLEKDPGARPTSAEELAQALARSASLAGEWTNERAAAWWRLYLPEIGATPTKTLGRSRQESK